MRWVDCGDLLNVESPDTNYCSGVRIVAERVLQPLYHIDFIWNRTQSAANLRKYNKFGREVFGKVSELTCFG